MNTKLKLIAETKEDLSVIAASVQDAIVKVSGILFGESAQVLTLKLSRFMHEKNSSEAGKRIKAGLRFYNILGLRGKDIDRNDPDAFMVLLDIAFDANKKPPGGILTFIFAGGGELKAQTDCLEARLMDYQEARTTTSLPLHPESE
ncbi:MAG: DUF2948 family protein [Robiginitomaculum sp.]